METISQSKSTASDARQKRSAALLLVIGFFVVVGVVTVLYLMLAKNQIYIEQSSIEAPIITISSSSGGELRQLFMKAGDHIDARTPIAQVGNDIVTAPQSGTILSTVNAIGQSFSPKEVVATMIHPDDLRLVAQVEEDKGLNDIRVGQSVFFTVDAFGSKQYAGIVDEVSQTARSGDIVFNISNTRQEQQFNVKIRFNQTAYPEIMNGMSAKTWIYKN